MNTDSTQHITPTKLELNGLYEPPSVAFTFETVGWTILCWLLALAVIITGLVLLRKYIKNKYRRDALQALNHLQQDDQIFVVLKKVAIHAFGRDKISSLYGKEWLQFLDQTSKKTSFIEMEQQVTGLIYQGVELDPQSKNKIMSNAKKWVKTHAIKL